MTEQEKIEFEREIRHKILMEQREYKSRWRASHKENIKRSNDKYQAKRKAKIEAARVINEEVV
jgi:hypothetical protein